MSRELTYLITEENIGTSPLTIHGFLKGRGYSHAVLVSLKKTPEGILKNGVWARVHDTLSPGDRLLVRLAEEKTSDHIVPRPLPFPVIYEDEDLLIVNKPANMPIHPSQGNYENTLPMQPPGISVRKANPLSTAASTVWTGIRPVF